MGFIFHQNSFICYFTMGKRNCDFVFKNKKRKGRITFLCVKICVKKKSTLKIRESISWIIPHVFIVQFLFLNSIIPYWLFISRIPMEFIPKSYKVKLKKILDYKLRLNIVLYYVDITLGFNKTCAPSM